MMFGIRNNQIRINPFPWQPIIGVRGLICTLRNGVVWNMMWNGSGLVYKNALAFNVPHWTHFLNFSSPTLVQQTHIIGLWGRQNTTGPIVYSSLLWHMLCQFLRISWKQLWGASQWVEEQSSWWWRHRLGIRAPEKAGTPKMNKTR